MSDEHTYQFDIKMTCSGCSGAITRVLEKAKTQGEVSAYSVSLDKQEVIATASITLDELQDKLRKTGKEIRSSVVVV